MRHDEDGVCTHHSTTTVCLSMYIINVSSMFSTIPTLSQYTKYIWNHFFMLQIFACMYVLLRGLFYKCMGSCVRMSVCVCVSVCICLGLFGAEYSINENSTSAAALHIETIQFSVSIHIMELLKKKNHSSSNRRKI